MAKPKKQPWELNAPLGAQTVADAVAAPPRFPPPPLAPIRDRGAHRLRLSNPRLSLPRSSYDSDASSTYSDAGSPPQPRAGGLRPPPPPRNMREKTRATMPTIPGSPTDETEQDGISPLLSRAPPALPASVPRSSNPTSLTPKEKSPAPTDNTPSTESPSSPSDDVIPDEHKRVPGLILRSPLSPTLLRGLSLGLMPGSKRRKRKPVPPPIVVVHPPRSDYLLEGKSAAIEMAAMSASSTTTTTTTPSKSPEMVNVGGEEPPAATAAKPKRRTVWGIIEGWWDLGLLERMNTVRSRRK
ncbi:hypothetical protein N656DRAFT_90652 [Canariomyces notabilis]|uniref:Uncharacterized protein n=1 Tax=Canariomyces notabilis TaxID=2074819 RepID=A0AAN6TDJ7_9PEZI|nr:hypothetical protein N656DRAFT_90652 [Canariomyces arenarius]